ncbi:hypothetical protein GQ53DRAFT_646752, partial [Thozetella sp. PMI_491]
PPPQPQTTLSPTKATGSSGGDSGTATPSPSSTVDPASAVIAISWPVSRAILGNFTPLILARIFVSFFSGAYQQVSMFEPIRLLLYQGGTTGSILGGGTSAAMLPVSIVVGVAHLGSAFAARSLYLDTNYCEKSDLYSASNPCWPPRLSVTPWVMTLLLTILCCVAVTMLYLIAFWFQSPKSITADPTSIVGVTVVMGHPDIEAEFAALPKEMTTKQLIKHLENRRFTLGDFDLLRAGQPAVLKFGIMPAPPRNAAEESRQRSAMERLEGGLAKTRNNLGLTDWKSWRVYVDVLFAMFAAALMGVAAASIQNVDDPRRVFIVSEPDTSISMRVIFAVLGVIISLYWGFVFRDAQTFAPYTALATRSSDPKPTLLLRRHILPITAIVPLLRNGHIVPGSVAFTALVSEVLVVVLAGLPYRPGQLKGEFLFCAIATLVILALMLVELGVTISWRAKCVPHLPRRPDTVAAVMTYVAGAKMNADFDGLEEVKKKERDAAVISLGKKYEYGEMQDDRGSFRWMVDQSADPGSERAKGYN